jgi:hypothetical protein
MVCFHRRYDLGDKHDLKHDDFEGWKEMSEYLIKEERAAIILPLYLYDHSGISMRVGSWVGHAQHAEWDSGQVGWIYMTKEDAVSNWGKGRFTKKVREKAEACLRSEVTEYDQYISGQVYGYVVEDEQGYVDEESCWGFFGYEYCVEEAKSAADWMATEKQEAMDKEFAEQLRENVRLAHFERCSELIAA